MAPKNVHSRAYNKERLAQIRAGVDDERAKELAREAGNKAVDEARESGLLDLSLDVD